MSLIGIDPTVALALAVERQARVRASFPRKPARRLPDPVRRTVQPGITATPRIPEPRVSEPQPAESGAVTRPAA